jgi:hypothetical protein
MPKIPARFQRGQAITEFVVAMLVLLPLVLGVIYIGKYEDVKYSAIQASRYVAFERVLDPSSAPRHKTDPVLAEETRARFFTDPMPSNHGAVGYQDSTQGRTLSTNWYGTGGDPAINPISGIGVAVQPATGLQIPLNQAFDSLARANFDIKDPGVAEADVTVPLANVVHFAPLSNLNLTIDAKTTVLTDGYNAGGADPGAPNNVHDRVYFDWGIVLGKIPGLKTAMDAIDNSIVAKLGWQALSGTDGPRWGCVTPDVVPSDATSQSPPVNYAGNCP